MDKLGLITDDMTGTMTCGVLLAKSGIRAASFFSPENMTNADAQEALIISANSRNLPKNEAQANVRAAYHALKDAGAKYFTKRIDTTYRGGVGYEVDALLDELGSEYTAFVVNTMPDTHRIVVGGYSVINGQILSETGAAHDVLSPVTESHIATLLSKQSKYPIGEIHIGTVLAGHETLRRAISQQITDGNRLIVIDAISTPHVKIIAETIYHMEIPMICVDSGAFTQQMAICRGYQHLDRIPQKQNIDVTISDSQKKVFVVAGSATDVTKEQISYLSEQTAVQVVSLTTAKLLSIQGKDEISSAITRLETALSNPDNKVVVLETAVNAERIDLAAYESQHALKPGAASSTINNALGHIVGNILSEPTISDSLCGMYMTGGDTLVTVLKAIGASGIRLIDTVQPQTNLGSVIGGPHDGLFIVGKGGMIGDTKTAENVVKRLIFNYQKLNMKVGEN